MRIEVFKTKELGSRVYDEGSALCMLSEEISKNISDENLISVNVEIVVVTASLFYAKAIVSYKELK